MPVTVGGQEIRPGDLVVLDADGATVVGAERADEVLAAARERERRERVKRAEAAGRRDVLRAGRPARGRGGRAGASTDIAHLGRLRCSPRAARRACTSSST